jgi:hypothetical protein
LRIRRRGGCERLGRVHHRNLAIAGCIFWNRFVSESLDDLTDRIPVFGWIGLGFVSSYPGDAAVVEDP